MNFPLDRPLIDVMYTSTFRCNYNCEMCFQNITRNKKNDELSFEQSIDIIKNSKYLSSLKTINVSGGEMFLKEGAIDFILKLEKIGIRSIITTNGYFTDKIIGLLKKLKNINSVHLAISLDGLEETNNSIRRTKNGYRHTMETIKCIKEMGGSLQVNTVMQEKNFAELEQIKEMIASMGVLHYFISLANDMQNPPKFSDEEVLKQFSYAPTEHDKKYILSKGSYAIKDCHAGIQSCYINPSGDVYCCQPGESSDRASNFFIGNMKDDSFDAIWTSSRIKEVYDNTVAHCEGCYFNCEASREVNYYNLSTEIFIDEVYILKNFMRDYVDWSFDPPGAWGWHEREEINSNIFFKWMAKIESKIFLKVKMQIGNLVKALEIKYMNVLTEAAIQLSVYINNRIVGSGYCSNGTHNLILPIEWLALQSFDIIEVKFQVNCLWSPSDYGSPDSRQLGIALLCTRLLYE